MRSLVQLLPVIKCAADPGAESAASEPGAGEGTGCASLCFVSKPPCEPIAVHFRQPPGTSRTCRMRRAKMCLMQGKGLLCVRLPLSAAHLTMPPKQISHVKQHNDLVGKW
jgi:hypothetical protein